MPYMRSRLLLASCVSIAVLGCAAHDASSAAISRQFDESKGISVNLATAVPGSWEQVCVLGPYSTNQTVKKTLGFEWSAETKTSIQTNDGISLLLFVQEKKIITFVEHPRNHGDFSNLSGQCFLKEKAQFTHEKKPPKG